ncbi:MAG: hypothetical protein D6713_08400 [Deltaproteobacteria bacterium]|nr:MAG: hypothetical protein D6713_08400 [Deltaproteobacteria bacterium]
MEGVSAMNRKRRILYGANAVVVAVVLLGIFIAVGYFATAYNKTFDFTEEKLFSLDPQTEKFLEELDTDVRVTGFFQKNSPGASRFLDLMKLYGEKTKRVTYRLIDPDEDPATAKSYGITRYGTIIAESGEKTKRTFELTEEAVTNLLIMVTRKGKKRVFFTSGHGERDIRSRDGEGIAFVADDLRGQGFEVEQGNILEKKDEWDENTLVVIPGTRKGFLKEEMKVLEEFIESGGNVLALIDPEEKDYFKEFLDKYGIVYEDGVIIDPSSRIFGGTPIIALVSSYSGHPSVRDFKLASFLALAGGLKTKTGGKGTPEILCRTGRGAWLEKGKLLHSVRFDSGKDVAGPITVAAVSTVPVREKEAEKASGTEKESQEAKSKGESNTSKSSKKEGRLLVVADSDFVSNHYKGFSGNGDLFLNLVKWMLSEEKILNIKPKKPKSSTYFLTPTAKKLWFAGAVVVLPLFIFATGLVTWRIRRKR